ncbi:SpoIIAA family protein [Constantimarinum furrinae]|uniref:STAS/SEC14 domain-containing protein n=1 Tax=Constantimarinum furrinae TaxID=2562285 RepID=A0A7G8PRT3_9FLAO|nr:STAS/SEC14 domain-containing protein [Constantimarinum furrinae]QNJ97049.1 hypothetical protein ALE3EI_0467 [Constantimarinum furrinae]
MLSEFSFSKDTVGFLIEGEFNEELSNQLHIQILEKFKEFDKINLYLEDSNIESFTLPAIVKEILFKIENADKFNKLALVTDRKWIHLCSTIESLFISINMKHFPTEDRLKAIRWIARR